MAKAFNTLKRNAEFKEVFETGETTANKLLAVYVKKNGFNNNRYGIVISRKVGKAVVRNKLRRRIREIVKNLFILNISAQNANEKKFYDLVIIARKSAPEADFTELRSGLEMLLKRLLRKLFKKTQEENV
jgi:ribonuclease P protein component